MKRNRGRACPGLSSAEAARRLLADAFNESTGGHERNIALAKPGKKTS